MLDLTQMDNPLVAKGARESRRRSGRGSRDERAPVRRRSKGTLLEVDAGQLVAFGRLSLAVAELATQLELESADVTHPAAG
jgi:hypothetical protein